MTRRLYQVMHDGMPMWVVAASFSDAIRRWAARIRQENPEVQEEWEPDGVTHICDGGDLLLPDGDEVRA